MIFDDFFVVPACATITSLLVNRARGINYTISVLTTGLSDDNITIIKQFESSYSGVKVSIINLDSTKYESVYKHYDGNTGAGSIIALLKFDIPNIIASDVVLYLDSDLIIKKDISKLFSFPLEDIYAAVVEDSGSLYNFSGLRSELKHYFNSGVMLLNCDLLRKENVSNKLLEAKRSLKDIKLVDQDAFNIVFDGKVALLPIKYNCLAVNLYHSSSKFDIRDLNKKYGTNYSCVFAVFDDASIVHYASKDKPWRYSRTPFVSLWDKYCLQSPFGKIPVKTDFSESCTKEIPIMLATDENYTPQTGVTILSALENRTYDVKYSFYIFTANEFSDSIVSKFKQIESTYGNCSINCVKMDEDLFSDVKLNIAHITHPTFYRLVAASKLPQYDKIIYMDSDVIVEQDLLEYFDTDLTDSYIAGVLGASYHWASDGNKKYCKENGLPSIDQYVNAGVLIFNLKLIRDKKIESEFIRLSKLGLRSQDQDVLNRACYNHIKFVPYKYNCMVAKYEKAPEQLLKVFSTSVINEANNCPVITHYAAERKPWADLSCALADRWWKYAFLSPYYKDFIDKYHNQLIDSGVYSRFTERSEAITNHHLPRQIIIVKKNFISRIVARLMRWNDNMVNVDYSELDSMWKSGDEKKYKALFDKCVDLIDSNDPQIIGRLARLYRDGKGTEKDLDKACQLMRIAAMSNIRWAVNEYVDILIEMNDPLSYLEAFGFCCSKANDDYPVLECRLARLYRDGKGTGSNINKAIDWMSRAVQSNDGWLGEYVDMLLKSNNSDMWVRAFEVASDNSSSKHPELQYKLYLMYSKGKGVKKDSIRAIEFLNKSAENGYKRAIAELEK